MSTAAVGPAPLMSDPPVSGNAPAGKTGLESVMTAAEGRGCLTADSFMVPRGDLELTDHQKELVAEARELISKGGISTNDVDDRTVMRFLVARALTPAKAAPLYVAHRKWRAAYIPEGSPTVPMCRIRTQAASDIMCLQTLPGHASWLLIRPRFHDPNTRDLDEFVRLIVYGMDAALGSSRAAGFHKCGVIIDMEGLAYRNLDTRGVIAAIAVLQNQYPERLICLFLIHVPTVFWTLWKLVSPFIDPITKKKVRCALTCLHMPVCLPACARRDRGSLAADAVARFSLDRGIYRGLKLVSPFIDPITKKKVRCALTCLHALAATGVR
ncbi:unnamed protein product [Closterium sp. Naga37s-1]|nr:unnamed protein product [Closterium sp. Naga37s-1]